MLQRTNRRRVSGGPGKGRFLIFLSFLMLIEHGRASDSGKNMFGTWKVLLAAAPYRFICLLFGTQPANQSHKPEAYVRTFPSSQLGMMLLAAGCRLQVFRQSGHVVLCVTWKLHVGKWDFCVCVCVCSVCACVQLKICKADCFVGVFFVGFVALVWQTY